MRCVWPLLLAVSSARADTPLFAPAATDADRDTSPPGGGELGFDAGTPLDTWAVAIAGTWIEQPVAFADAVRRRQTLVVGGALALGPSVVVDGRFALSHQVGERLRELGSVTRLDRFVPGDLRLGVRLHVAHPVFLRGELSLPTGDAHDFAGESSWMAAWGLIARFELPAGIVLAATGGIRLRGDEVLVAERVVGNELFGAAGIIGRVLPELALTGEIAASLGDEVQGVQGPYPAEARAGVVVSPLPFVQVAVRGGAGLNDELGAPAFRVMLQVAYRGPNKLLEPVPPPPDDEITASR